VILDLFIVYLISFQKRYNVCNVSTISFTTLSENCAEFLGDVGCPTKVLQ